MLSYILLQTANLTDGQLDMLNEAEKIDENAIDLWELLKDGGWYIMIPLGILLVLAVYIFIERFLTISKASKIKGDFINRIKDYIHDGKIEAAKDVCRSENTPMARMMEKGVSRIGKPIKEINAAIENVGKVEVFNLERGLSLLATVSGAAPMIGFLGTVIGMMGTFLEMSRAGNNVQIDALSGGIMQAMVTTVAGLIIGIIAYFGYNTLIAKVDKVVNQMQSAAIEFLDLLDEPGK